MPGEHDQTPPAPNATPNPGDDQNKGPTPEQFAEAMNAVKRLEAANKKLTDDFNSAQTKLKDIEKAKLEGSGDFKKLWEDERKLREESESKLTELKSNFVLTQKHIAAKDAFIKAGMNPEAMKLLDRESFDDLDVSVNDSRFEVKGTETLVAKWKQEFPFMFKTEKTAPHVNTGGTGGGNPSNTGPMTAAKLFEIERKSKLGSRDPEYQKAALEFAKQRAQS